LPAWGSTWARVVLRLLGLSDGCVEVKATPASSKTAHAHSWVHHSWIHHSWVHHSWIHHSGIHSHRSWHSHSSWHSHPHTGHSHTHTRSHAWIHRHASSKIALSVCLEGVGLESSLRVCVDLVHVLHDGCELSHRIVGKVPLNLVLRHLLLHGLVLHLLLLLRSWLDWVVDLNVCHKVK